jgi:glutamate synthase (NADPH) small chain
VSAISIERVEFTAGRFEPVAGTREELTSDFVLLAMGFVGPEQNGVVGELGLELDARQNIAVDAAYMSSVPSVFACGDAARGQSLIVWAIAEGRSAASAVDRFLMGRTDLPAPLRPNERALT